MVVLSLAILPIFDLLVTETRRTGDLASHIFATTVTAGIIERFKAEPFEWLAANLPSEAAGQALIQADPLLTPPPGSVPEDYTERLAGYERFVEFQRDSSDPRKGILIAHVVWVSERRRVQEMEMKVILTDLRFPTGKDEPL